MATALIVLIDEEEEEEVAVEHVVVVVDSADVMEAEEAIDLAAAETETTILETTILKIGSLGNDYVNHDGI